MSDNEASDKARHPYVAGVTSPSGASSPGAAVPADVGRYLQHLVEMTATAHRLGGHPDPTSRPLVKATMTRLARERGRPRNRVKA